MCNFVAIGHLIGNVFAEMDYGAWIHAHRYALLNYEYIMPYEAYI
jgi:hypothetical protein